MDALKKYFTGPVLLSTVAGVLVCAFAFVDRDPSKPLFVPILTLLAGLAAIGAGAWGGLKRIGDERNVLRAIGPKVRHIISFSNEQFSSMAVAARELSLHEKGQPTEGEVRLVFSKLDPRAPSTTVETQTGHTLNWLEFMYQYSARSRVLVQYVYQFMPFLDPMLVRILGELEDCYHFKEIELIAHSSGPANKNLEFAALAFLQYQRIVNELHQYFDDNLKEYTKNTPAMAVQPII